MTPIGMNALADHVPLTTNYFISCCHRVPRSQHDFLF